MAGRLGVRWAGLRLVPQLQAQQVERLDRLPGQPLGRLRIVVAEHPDQGAAGGDGVDLAGVLGGQPLLGVAVVEGVPQQHHDARVQCRHLLGEPAQGVGGVVGRQELAAGGEGRPLLQVQVGRDQGAFALDPEGAGGAQAQLGARHHEADSVRV